MIGDYVKHYRILSLLGSGGMGEVYKAEDTRLRRVVALKFLRGSLATDTAARERFLNEAVAASALDHPNICTVYEIGEQDDGALFIAMAYYEGETLRDRIRRGPVPVDEARAIVLQLARALSAAHARGIVHRDIKPENVFLTTAGVVKVVDFGLAKLDRPANDSDDLSTSGTLSYMAPEQLRGEEADTRSDLWAMGILLFELLTGKLPFNGYIPAAVVYSIMSEDAADLTRALPSVPDPLLRVYTTAVVKDREARLASASEAVRILEDTPVATRPSRRGATAIVATALLLLLAGAWTFWPKGDVLSSDDGKIHIAVLPFLIGPGGGDSASLAGPMQQQLIGELTAHAEFGVTPSYSIDEALMRYFHGTQPMQLDGRFKKFLQSIAVDYAVKGTLHRNGAARTVQVSIVNAKNNYVEFACDSAVHDDADVPVVLHALAANVVGYFSVSAELSKDVSMRMWVADASKSIDAQICFLRGFQEIANGGSAGERMYDALSYDSTFVSARVWLVSSLMNKGRKEEAREQYRILLGQERAASLPARVMIRYAGAMIDENPDEMARNLENALEFAPGNYVLQTNLAHVKHVLRGQYREALAMIRPLIDVRWAYPGLYGMAAKCYYQLGQLDSAWMAIERHRPASDNDMDCLAVSAVLNERAARTAAALSEVARACNVFPLLRVPLSGAAMTAVSEQSRSASEHCVRRMRQLFRRRGVTTDVALCDVSSYLFEYGEPVLAERYVREALVMAPNSVECLEQLGLVLRKQGNIAEAAACFAMLLTLDPKSEAARLGLADIAWTSGDLAEASEQYRALLSGNASAISIDTATARLARAGSSAAHRSSRDR